MALQQEKISIIASSQTHGTKSKTAAAEQPKGTRSPRTCSPEEGGPEEDLGTTQAKISSQNPVAECTGTKKHGNGEGTVKEDDILPPLVCPSPAVPGDT